MNSITKTERYLYIDFIKIIACFFVIINHTIERVFVDIEPSKLWFVSLTYFFISKPAVPLFLMASGTVLLGKRDSYKKSFQRISKMFIVLLIISFIYISTFQKTYNGLVPFTLQVISKPASNALWYMYLYIGILFMLPFLQKMCSVFKKVDYQYFIGVTVLGLGTIPLIAHLMPSFSVNVNFITPIFSTYIGLFVAGYFIHNYIEFQKKYMHVATIGVILILVIEVIASYLEYETIGNSSYKFYSNREMILITLSSMFIFYIAKGIFVNINISDKWSKRITSISSCTFGIYLISDLYIGKFLFVYTKLVGILNPFIAIVIFEIVVFIAGLISVIIIKKIPFFNDILS